MSPFDPGVTELRKAIRRRHIVRRWLARLGDVGLALLACALFILFSSLAQGLDIRGVLP